MKDFKFITIEGLIQLFENCQGLYLFKKKILVTNLNEI